MTVVPDRQSILERIVSMIASHRCNRRALLVGIDGVDGAGKTSLADELSYGLMRRGHHTVRASADGFHNPREVRLARGPLSPEGYYHDSYDYNFLTEKLLGPVLTQQLPAQLPVAKFDWQRNAVVPDATATITENTIIVLDGIFLFRPTLNKFWDFRIFLRVTPETSLRRGIEGDSAHLGGAELTREKY